MVKLAIDAMAGTMRPGNHQSVQLALARFSDVGFAFRCRGNRPEERVKIIHCSDVIDMGNRTRSAR